MILLVLPALRRFSRIMARYVMSWDCPELNSDFFFCLQGSKQYPILILWTVYKRPIRATSYKKLFIWSESIGNQHRYGGFGIELYRLSWRCGAQVKGIFCRSRWCCKKRGFGLGGKIFSFDVSSTMDKNDIYRNTTTSLRFLLVIGFIEVGEMSR